MSNVVTHEEYTSLEREFNKVIDCLEGERAVKEKGYDYLPHPSQIDKDSPENQIRYLEYKAGAEFDNAPDKTRRTWLGKMRLADTTIELPDAVEYLINDVNGDGLDMRDAISHSISEAMGFGFQLLVADYTGLQGLPIDSLSIADTQALAPRAKIVQYTRPNIVDWDFERVDGKMQLTYLKLREIGSKREAIAAVRKKVESFLILALDENGEYYQQKEFEGELSEPDYPTVNGSTLRWLPVQFVADSPMPGDCLPKRMGVLMPIINKALQIYVKTAQMDEHQRALCPTNSVSGMNPAKWEQFKEINGRDYIARGGFGLNIYPENVESKTESPEGSLESYFRKIEELKKDIRELGGENETERGNMTAREAEIVASSQTAILEGLAASAENAWRRVITYCAMFEGLIAPEDVENDIDDFQLTLPRDFSKPRSTVEEVRVLLELRGDREISQAELHRQLKNGGWLIEEAETVLQEIENEPGAMTLPEFVGERDLTGEQEED